MDGNSQYDGNSDISVRDAERVIKRIEKIMYKYYPVNPKNPYEKMSDIDREKCEELEQEYDFILEHSTNPNRISRLKEQINIKISGDIGRATLDFFDDDRDFSRDINRTGKVLEGAYEALNIAVRERKF